MVRPACFGFNEETASSNSFQTRSSLEEAGNKAVEEFDGMVGALREHDVPVVVVNDSPEPEMPMALWSFTRCSLRIGDSSEIPL